MNKQQQIHQLKLETAKHPRFKSRCYVCHAPLRGKGVFHHIWYEEAEKIYSDFQDKLEYTIYVIGKIRENPKRFLLLCSNHHVILERMKRWKPENLDRLIRAVRMKR